MSLRLPRVEDDRSFLIELGYQLRAKVLDHDGWVYTWHTMHTRTLIVVGQRNLNALIADRKANNSKNCRVKVLAVVQG